MIFSHFHFLFVLLLINTTYSQVLPSSSFCLGNCTNCDPLSLTKCMLPDSCDWNFYSEKGDEQCFLAPSTQLVFQELAQINTKIFQNLSKGWSQSKKQLQCEYVSSEGKKYIQILGLYSGVQVLQKTFDVDPLSDIYELTFDLLHSPWLPFNDFLIVDFMSQNENILSLEISFDSRISVDSQVAIITCSGTRVMTRKYSIKFANYNRVNSQLTAVFTSFLFNAVWGITNIRLQQGCLGFSVFNSKTLKCNQCDSDSYLITRRTADWCSKCPPLCRTCQSKTKCLVCFQGANLNKSELCQFGDKYKTQVAFLGQNVTNCDGDFIFESSSRKVTINEIKNDQELLYDQIQIGFELYYFPSSWKSTIKSYISVKLNKLQVMRLDYRNMTNVGVIRCNAFKDKRAAKIQLLSSKIVHNNNMASIEFELVGNQKNMQFGIGSVRVKSLIKRKSTPILMTLPVMEVKPVNNVNSSFIANITKNQDIQVKLNNTKNNQTKIIPQVLKLVETTLTNSTKFEPQTPTVIPEVQKTNPPIIVVPTHINKTQTLKQVVNQTQMTNSTSSSAVPQKIEVSKFIQDVILNAQTSNNISFVTSNPNDQSDIQIHICGHFSNQNVTYNIFIDKLDQSEYRVNSFKAQDAKLKLFIKINQSFTDANVAIYSITTSRLLTQGFPQLVGTFKINRFDALTQNQIQSLHRFSNLFSVFAWMALILIFLTVLIGNGVTVEQLIISLQVIFLHIYIGSEYLPLTFRDVIGGLNITKNLNFFVPSHKQNIDNNWFGDSSSTGHARLYLFDSQIYFLREFYPIIFVNLIYLIWFGCVYYAKKRLNKDLIDQQKQIHHRSIDNIINRIINFCDQIWRYQFVSTMWICFVQFYDISSPHSGAVINGFVCILAFICSVSWPVFVTLYCRRQYYECQYSQYLYFYQDIYYCKIPQYQLPSQHHRHGYPIIKSAKLFLITLVTCYFGFNPVFALFTLMTIQVAEVLYTKKYDIYVDKRYWILRVIQNGLFVIIEFVLLVMLLCDKIASSNVYKSMGYFLSVLALLIVINSAIRTIYLGHKKFKQLSINDYEQDYEVKKPQTQRIV